MKKIFIVTFVFLMISMVSLHAKEVGDDSFQFKGLVYLNWHINMTDGTDNEDGSKKNTFEMERLYLTFLKDFDKIWGFRATTDVGNETVEEDGKEQQKYRLFIKFAYVQAKKSIGPLDLQFRAGMVNTPVSGFNDWLSNQRWAHKNCFLASKDILKKGSTDGAGQGYSIDNPADMGVNIRVTLMKIVTLAGSITNGEGYKKTDEEEQGSSSEGKAYAGRLTLAPFKGLYISGFYRFEGTDTDESDNHRGYYGGGIAWADKSIRVGVNCAKAFEKQVGKDLSYNGEEYDMKIVDIWLTLNFESLTGVPVLVVARYFYGDNGLDNGTATLLAGGIGYRLAKNFRVIAWYEQLDNEADDKADNADPDRTFYIKSEVKF